MPDIEDIIEGLAPFAFILIWVFSAIMGRAKEQPPAKTTRPVFSPARPADTAVGTETVPAGRAPGEKVDWSKLDTQNPYSGENIDPAAAEAQRSAAQEKQDRLAKALRDQKKREAAAARREAEAARKAAAARKSATEQAAKKQPQQQGGKPVDIFHLVSDHSAEAHLEHALTDRPAGISTPARNNSLAMAAIISDMQDRDSVRKALIMSIVLGEPKCKVGRGPGA